MFLNEKQKKYVDDKDSGKRSQYAGGPDARAMKVPDSQDTIVDSFVATCMNPPYKLVGRNCFTDRAYDPSNPVS